MELRWQLCGVVFVALLLSGSKAQLDVCGVSQLNSRIVGGSNAPAGAWPWHAAVIFNYNLRCSGSLINNEWILTSAVCANGVKPSNLKVWLGAESLEKPSSNMVEHNVASIIIHSLFRPTSLNNNIALLKMSSPVNFTKYIAPVCLAKSGSTYDEGYLWVTGFGDTGTHDLNPSPRYLREVDVPIVTNSECQKVYYDPIPSNVLCAGREGKGTCDGDSGSPLVGKNANMSRWVQSGLMAFRANIGCAVARFPEGYTRVASYENWIKSHIKTNQPGFITGAPLSAGTSLVPLPLLLLLLLSSVLAKAL